MNNPPGRHLRLHSASVPEDPEVVHPKAEACKPGKTREVTRSWKCCIYESQGLSEQRLEFTGNSWPTKKLLQGLFKTPKIVIRTNSPLLRSRHLGNDRASMEFLKISGSRGSFTLDCAVVAPWCCSLRQPLWGSKSPRIQHGRLGLVTPTGTRRTRPSAPFNPQQQVPESDSFLQPTLVIPAQDSGHVPDVCENPRREVCTFCFGIGHTRQACPSLVPGSEAGHEVQAPNYRSHLIKLLLKLLVIIKQKPSELTQTSPQLGVRQAKPVPPSLKFKTLSQYPKLIFKQLLDLIESYKDNEDLSVMLGTQMIMMFESSQSILTESDDQIINHLDLFEGASKSLSQEPGRSRNLGKQAASNTTSSAAREAFVPRILQGRPLPPAVQHRLTGRKLFVSGADSQKPTVTARIPVSVWIFGVKLNGILDTGSERSYINARVYDDVKDYASGELRDDQTKKGILLANQTLCKSLGGAPFIIQVGSVAGEQYLSVLEDLGYSIVLGMDFAIQFSVQIDCDSKTWKFKNGTEQHPFELLDCKEGEVKLQAMSTDQEKVLQEFLKRELKKFEKV
ncbi:hypothetical protein KQX54_010401 [Cotesia glomerata]|uniref:Peptidase A2 domain-containing protein n=1 Tax=Cotesia glomerata TaxID=32391 RepID=A0AAV7HZR4_COTGL|nr:hypothetical protein KQX54_010401 [Cotesia glomerata]